MNNLIVFFNCSERNNKMNKQKLLAVLGLLINTTCLYAGTMGESIYCMDGFYIGGGTGINTLFSKDSFTNQRGGGRVGSDSNNYTNSSILFMGQAGYGKMVGPKTYLGAKGSIYYTPLDNLTETGFSTSAGSILYVGNNSINTQLRPFYNIDAVLGYEYWDHFLPFVEGGVTFSDIHNYYTLKRTRTNLSDASNVKYEYGASLDNYKTGYNVGIGANYQPHPHWIFSGELLYNYFRTNADSSSVTIPGTNIVESQSRSIFGNDLVLSGSVSYLF